MKNIALKQSVVKQSAIQLSKKPYSTTTTTGENEHTSTTEVKEHQEEKKPEKHFWEIPDHPDSRRPETNRSVKSRTTRAAAEQRDFRDLLDTLFDRKPYKFTQETPAIKPPSHNSIKTDSVIEKKLLDLVMKNRQLYKDKAPLPRSMMAPIYGKSSSKFRKQHQQQQQEEEDGSDVLDFLIPPSSSSTADTTNWDPKDITRNKRIQEKEKELQAINAIVSTNSSLELLSCINQHIGQSEYPTYYPSILTKAIEHASARNDPYLALTIFELAKTKSMQSYVLGCTTKVYDAMLLLRWEIWRDVYGMLELVEEMTVNGVKYSNNSRRIVRSVVQEIEAEGVNTDEEEEEERQGEQKGIYWNADEKRACNVMKELVGKWIVNK